MSEGPFVQSRRVLKYRGSGGFPFNWWEPVARQAEVKGVELVEPDGWGRVRRFASGSTDLPFPAVHRWSSRPTCVGGPGPAPRGPEGVSADGSSTRLSPRPHARARGPRHFGLSGGGPIRWSFGGLAFSLKLAGGPQDEARDLGLGPVFVPSPDSRQDVGARGVLGPRPWWMASRAGGPRRRAGPAQAARERDPSFSLAHLPAAREWAAEETPLAAPAGLRPRLAPRLPPGSLRPHLSRVKGSDRGSPWALCPTAPRPPPARGPPPLPPPPGQEPVVDNRSAGPGASAAGAPSRGGRAGGRLSWLPRRSCPSFTPPGPRLPGSTRAPTAPPLLLHAWRTPSPVHSRLPPPFRGCWPPPPLPLPRCLRPPLPHRRPRRRPRVWTGRGPWEVGPWAATWLKSEWASACVTWASVSTAVTAAEWAGRGGAGRRAG